MTWENAQVVKRTEAATHFIGLDEQPLSVVRFHQYEIPSCNYSTNIMVPEVFAEANKLFCNMVNEASATDLTTDIQILPETFQVWKYQYLQFRVKYSDPSIIMKKILSVHPYWLDGR